jgi:hypothetical protein
MRAGNARHAAAWVAATPHRRQLTPVCASSFRLPSGLTNSGTGAPIQASERRGRILAVHTCCASLILHMVASFPLRLVGV